MAKTFTTPTGSQIGHVHLKVADLDRAIAFYSGVLGFTVTQRYGHQAAFLGADGYHHHIGLNTWESAGAPRPRRVIPVCITRRSCIPTARPWPGSWPKSLPMASR